MFNILLTTLVLLFMAITSTTFYLQKSNIIIALEAASLYVQYTRRSTTPRLYLVNSVCTYSIQRITNCVKGNYWYTNNHRFFKDTAHIGFITFPRNAKSPHAAQSPTDSWLTQYLYMVPVTDQLDQPVSYTTPRVATSPPANFIHYRSYIGQYRRSLTHQTSTYLVEFLSSPNERHSNYRP